MGESTASSHQSLCINFQKRGGTCLNCKACEACNWKNRSVKTSHNESATYWAVFNSPADPQVPEHKVAIDHKLFGGELSAVGIHLPGLSLTLRRMVRNIAASILA